MTDFQIVRNEIQIIRKQNPSPPEQNPNPAERNPNFKRLNSFAELSLFNHLRRPPTHDAWRNWGVPSCDPLQGRPSRQRDFPRHGSSKA
jgi:hypothetical protein